MRVFFFRIRVEVSVDAAPLYEERKAIVNGEKEVPAPKEAEGEAKEEEGVPAGIPEFWLGVLRANRVIGESVSHSFLHKIPLNARYAPWPNVGVSEDLMYRQHV